MVRVPGLAGKRVEQPVALIDVVPTLMELTGDARSTAGLSGQSLLVPALTPEKVDPNRPVLCSIASVTDRKGTFFRRAVRRKNLALFESVSEGRFSLFDTATDAGELTDVANDPRHGKDLTEMKALLKQSLTGNMHDHKVMRAAAQGRQGSRREKGKAAE